MKEIQRGFKQRVTRVFFQNNVATNCAAIVVSILDEEGNPLATTDEGTFTELDISSQTTGTGEYYISITPDSDEAIGVWIVYWRYTYGAGAAAETTIAQEIIRIIDEDAVPILADNYFSLDAVNRIYPQLFDIKTADELIRIGHNASRVLDSELDGRFDVPIRKRADLGTYDRVLVDAAVLLTIHRTIKERYPEEAEDFYNDYTKIIDGINSGRFRLWEEITSKEIGFQPPRPATTNAGTKVELEISPHAVFAGFYHTLLIIQIDGAGDIGTATYKASIDGGKTWETETQTTADTWLNPTGCLGLRFRFFRRGSSGNLADGDKWEIEAWPIDQPTTPTGGSIRRGKVIL